jgi:hypothetical protein
LLFVIGGCCSDDTLLAEYHTVHLLHIEFGLGDQDSESNRAYFFTLQKHVLFPDHLTTLESSRLPVDEPIFGILGYFGIGDVVFDMV